MRRSLDGRIQFGATMTSAVAGSARAMYLIVLDVAAAGGAPAGRSANASEGFQAGTLGAQFQPGGTSARASGSAPDDASCGSFAAVSGLDGNGWLFQVTTRLPRRVSAAQTAYAGPANYEAIPRVTYTDPQAAAVGAVEAKYTATAPLSEEPKTATYTHGYAKSIGFLTLLSDGQRLTGAYALGPEAGEWLQQATLAIRAHVPVDVLDDTIQPFPSFSGAALTALRLQIAGMPPPARADACADSEPFPMSKCPA